MLGNASELNPSLPSYNRLEVMSAVGIVLGIVNWCLNSVATLIFLLILIIGIIHHRHLREVSLILTYNTCFAALLACLAVSVMSGSDLTNGFLTFNLDLCYSWGLLYDVFQCSIYHSYYLQAFYRLCRVVFYKKKSLVSFSLFMALIVGQWSLTVLILLPPLFLGWYVRLPIEQYCLVPYTNVGAELYHILILQLIPLAFIIGAYVWITQYIRHSSRQPTTILAKNQRQRNQRDLTVIRRIVVLISILVALRFPTIVFMIHAVVVGQLYPLTFGIVGLITSACMVLMGIMLVHITPQLRSNRFVALIYRDNRVHIQQVAPQQVAPVPALLLPMINLSIRLGATHAAQRLCPPTDEENDATLQTTLTILSYKDP